jgi:hypothetical protein
LRSSGENAGATRLWTAACTSARNLARFVPAIWVICQPSDKRLSAIFVQAYFWESMRWSVAKIRKLYREFFRVGHKMIRVLLFLEVLTGVALVVIIIILFRVFLN